MAIGRRDFLRMAAAAGGLLAARPLDALASPLVAGPGVASAGRVSRLFPVDTRLAHGDLHNHSHLSDGAGDPWRAFDSMRDAGLDVAALTDHSTQNWGVTGVVDPCSVSGEPDHGERSPCVHPVFWGLNEERWEVAGTLADLADAPGVFTAIRGFEWSSRGLGHMNVWDSQRWIDPLHTGGWDFSGSGNRIWPLGNWTSNFPQPVRGALRSLFNELGRESPTRGSGMAPFYKWLELDPSTPVLGGGADGIASFNHPGREAGRFSHFQLFPEMRERIVALEIMNREEDYLFKNIGMERPSPLVECLNAGWRTGLIGVSDHHGISWGFGPNDGRAGIWVGELSRAGVREALQARRVFATRERGLRLDAAVEGVRMGGVVPHRSGPVNVAVDLSLGADLAGMPVEVQVLRPEDRFPTVVHIERTAIAGDDDPVISFVVELDVADGDWLVLRIADPSRASDSPGPDGHPANNWAVAYSSPFWLEPPG